MKNASVLILLGMLILSACTDKTEKDETKNTFSDQHYLNQGKEIASATFDALSTKLQAAIKEGGVENAIEYCNLAALPIVDSLSSVYGAGIRRTSRKVRNPQDAPNDQETRMLATFHNQINNQESIGPRLERSAGQVHFFAPIKVNAFCLQCHGKVGETLTVENYDIIKQRYPEDQAVGYTDGALRGMWSITFGE